MQCVRLLLEGLGNSPVLFPSAALYMAMELLLVCEAYLGGVPINKMEKNIGNLSPITQKV